MSDDRVQCLCGQLHDLEPFFFAALAVAVCPMLESATNTGVHLYKGVWLMSREQASDVRDSLVRNIGTR